MSTPLHRISKGRSGHFVIGPYDEELIAKIKALPRSHRAWDPDKKAWKIRPDGVDAVKRIIAHHYAGPEDLERMRIDSRLAYCERRLAALRADKKAWLRKDWGIGPKQPAAVGGLNLPEPR